MPSEHINVEFDSIPFCWAKSKPLTPPLPLNVTERWHVIVASYLDTRDAVKEGEEAFLFKFTADISVRGDDGGPGRKTLVLHLRLCHSRRLQRGCCFNFASVLAKMAFLNFALDTVYIR